jgi:hypothetical protein
MSETDEGPKLIYLGSFDSGLHHLTLPAAPIRRIEARLDAEREKREREVERARLAVLQAAQARSKLRRALSACFRHVKGRR